MGLRNVSRTAAAVNVSSTQSDGVPSRIDPRTRATPLTIAISSASALVRTRSCDHPCKPRGRPGDCRLHLSTHVTLYRRPGALRTGPPHRAPKARLPLQKPRIVERMFVFASSPGRDRTAELGKQDRPSVGEVRHLVVVPFDEKLSDECVGSGLHHSLENRKLRAFDVQLDDRRLGQRAEPGREVETQDAHDVARAGPLTPRVLFAHHGRVPGRNPWTRANSISPSAIHAAFRARITRSPFQLSLTLDQRGPRIEPVEDVGPASASRAARWRSRPGAESSRGRRRSRQPLGRRMHAAPTTPVRTACTPTGCALPRTTQSADRAVCDHGLGPGPGLPRSDFGIAEP